MSDVEVVTSTENDDDSSFRHQEALPAILLAHAKDSAALVDRCLLKDLFTIGRGADCDLQILDEKISKNHAQIIRDDDLFSIIDLGSTNKTYLNGECLTEKKLLKDGDIIRMGQAVMIFKLDARALLGPPQIENYGFIGPFHASKFLSELKEAALSSKHILLAGPSGSGKELAARAIADMTGKSIRCHNAARYTSGDEAAATLFGIAPKTFSGVAGRPGLIEQAKGGVLFVDEVHNLPERVQRSLLRIIEDGYMERFGETKGAEADIRFVFASNAPPPIYSLAEDFLARLRAVRVPSLCERVADIPAIFKHLIASSLRKQGLEVTSAMAAFTADHFESLVLDGFENKNVRGLFDIVDRVATRAQAGVDIKESARTVFLEKYPDNPVAKRQGARFGTKTTYKSNIVTSNDPTRAEIASSETDLVFQAHEKYGGNIAAMEKALKANGLTLSRRRLTKLVDFLKLPRIKKKKGT